MTWKSAFEFLSETSTRSGLADRRKSQSKGQPHAMWLPFLDEKTWSLCAIPD